jgi:hypothetical protein
MISAPCEQCREKPAELLLTYSEQCRITVKPICRDCAQAPRIRGPYTVTPLPEKK